MTATNDVPHLAKPDNKRSEPAPSKFRRIVFVAGIIRRVVFVAGIICCGQFVVTALIGVVRGYSVQGHWSSVVMSFGYLCLALCLNMRPRRITTASFSLAALLFIASALVSIAQGKHERLGTQHYEQGRYKDALNEFHKETGTWYLRLRYNYHEAIAMREAAKAYCQLEDFDAARAIYEKMTGRYDDFHRQRARERLAEMVKAFDDMRAYRQAIENETDPFKKAMIMFGLGRAYQYPLSCKKKAIEVYERIAEMDVPEMTRQSAGWHIKVARTGKIISLPQLQTKPATQAAEPTVN